MEKQTRTQQVKIVPIGNSQGIRLSKAILRKYGFADMLILEETETGIFLHKQGDKKLSWADTYKAMSDSDEDWSDFDTTLADGLEKNS